MGANTRVGAPPSTQSGSYEAVPEDACGTLLRRFAARFDLVAPATISEHSGGVPPETWFSSPGKGRRLDYIPTPAR
eukprot:8047234-Alexandrium_andersonii.AAC.1